MRNDILQPLRHLSDDELVTRVKQLTARERDTTAQLVAHLAELDTRDVHLKLGYGSLFAYCRDALCLSEHEAYNRIEVARAARRFPVILEMLVEGSVNLTTVRLLAPHLTLDNHERVLESARGKRKAEVEEIVAALSPRPDVSSTIRRLPLPPPPLVPASPSPSGALAPTLTAVLQTAPSPAPSTLSSRHAVLTPLSPGRYRVQVTIGADTLQKLRLAKDLLRHAIPSGDEAAILDRALTVLLADLARRKYAATGRAAAAGAVVLGLDTGTRSRTSSRTT
jgi:hypothetical protein